MPKLRGVSEEGAEFLGRYAEEVSLLADGLARLQDSLGLIYARVAATGGAEDLQRLDAFTQTAEALARIASQFTKEPTLDGSAVALLVSNVELADVAARLVGDAGEDPHWGSGDIEVF